MEWLVQVPTNLLSARGIDHCWMLIFLSKPEVGIPIGPTGTYWIFNCDVLRLVLSRSQCFILCIISHVRIHRVWVCTWAFDRFLDFPGKWHLSYFFFRSSFSHLVSACGEIKMWFLSLWAWYKQSNIKTKRVSSFDKATSPLPKCCLEFLYHKQRYILP